MARKNISKSPSPSTSSKEQEEQLDTLEGQLDPAKIPGGIISIAKSLEDFSAQNFPVSKPVVETMSEAEVTVICSKVASLYGIHRITALNAICEMIRKGGANRVTPGTFSIPIHCPEEKVRVEIQKRDVVRTIEMVTSEKTFRTLADTLAEQIIRVGIRRTEMHPDVDFGGDLARKMSVRLAFLNRPPLTPKERVGCASYAQNISNLNELTGSDRLSSLLAEDLELRRATATNDKSSQPKSAPNSKGFAKNQKKSTTGKIEQRVAASNEATRKGKKAEVNKKEKKGK